MMKRQKELEGYGLLKLVNFNSIVGKAKELKGKIEKELKESDTPKEIDDKIATRIK
jgi:hypothetical protein